MNLILCGLPGSGKSTTCRLLAQRLGCPLLETDQEIEQMYAKQTGQKANCREIHKHLGEAAFRELENRVLSSFQGTHHVIDVGGGILTHAENAQILKKLGTLIYFKVDREVVFQRLMEKGTPSYLDVNHPYESFIALAKTRELLYQKYADIILEVTNLTPSGAAEKILERVKL